MYYLGHKSFYIQDHNYFPFHCRMKEERADDVRALGLKSFILSSKSKNEVNVCMKFDSGETGEIYIHIHMYAAPKEG